MPGMNGFTTRTGAILDELLRDEAHLSAFNGFLAEQVIGDAYRIPVSDVTAAVDLVPVEYDAVALLDGVRSAKVAHDAPTPKGNSKIEQVLITCEQYRKAHSISHLSRSSTRALYRDLEELMRTKSGLDVKAAVEADFLTIARGLGSQATYNGSDNTALLTAQQWDNYAGVSHDPIKDISDKMLATGATKFLIGRDVAQALKGSPKFTGSSAGSGTEFLTDQQLIDKLLGLGFQEVWIAGKSWVNTRSPNLPAALARIHNGIAVMWGEGAIRQYVFEDFFYDEFESEDNRKTYHRAIQTSVFFVPFSQSVGTFTNILG